ncbi:MAG: hypothetical protein L3J66_12175 [Bacteroidales bacterium]|nr:hypothetical protein [Bacteroidales bacterium]
MKKIFILFSVLAFLLLPRIGRAQDTVAFNSEQFFWQISEVLLNTPSKLNQEKSKALLDRFGSRWSMGRFNRAEKQEIQRLVEKMHSKKLKTYPYLYNYVHALTLLSESKQLPKSIIAWHVYAQQLLEGLSTKDFSAFLKFTRNLFENNKLFDKRTLAWYYRDARFAFELDTSFLLRYERLNLIAATKKDSSVILKTKGVFNYENSSWTGKGGTVKWGRFGRETGEKIFVKVESYEINLKQSSYTIDSAVLYYDRFFSQPVLGRFTDKIMSGTPGKRASYPRFETYLDDYELKDLYPGIDYFGGYSMQGKTVYGIGGPYTTARLNFWYRGHLIGKVNAAMIQLGEEKFQAANAELVFYFDADSVFHPDLRVKYANKNRLLVMFIESRGSQVIPFFDSYHQLDIYSQALTWNMDSSTMNFERIAPGGGNAKTARFISSNYFSERDFYTIQGMDELNPMYIIRNYLNTYSDEVIQLNALADFMDKSPEQVSSMLIKLARKGFVVYNPKNQTATVKDRLYYFLDAKTGNRDFDVISIESNVRFNPNATVNLQTYDLDVYGVPEVHLSDSQEMYIFPYDKTISFKKNRDFTFDGQVHTGLFDFFSHQSTFIYDSFMVNMNFVDSLKFKVYVVDSLQKAKWQVRVQSKIVDLNGKLYIDQPFNKSGLHHYGRYPYFVSNEESYVRYNKRSIQDSTLRPENFYYKLDPFVFDSISTFETTGLAFEGTLVSAGIFKPLNEPLVVMPDYSLGIRHQAPPDSVYPVYGGKGSFRPEITLSNRGFHGKGTLTYLNSTTVSDNFTFYPDSVSGIGESFAIHEDAAAYDLPFVKGDSVKLTWLTDTNVMRLDLLGKPFDMYDSASLQGKLYLDNQKLRGEGTFFFDQSEITSNNIQFGRTKLTADSADFFLSRSDTNIHVFESKGYFASIDFEAQKGSFTHLYDNSFVKFPFNSYISTLEEVEWFMDESKLELRSGMEEVKARMDSLSNDDLIAYPLSGHEFISVKEEQDSLRFFADKATYNLQQYTIDVEGVRLIKVADAAVFPENAYVKIERDAEMDPLLNALIIADTRNKYHHIYDAEVRIYGRHNYTATGTLDYVDRNKAVQPLNLDSIYVGDYGVTNGFARLPAGELFFLSPEYFFTGSIRFTATEQFLRFTGGYRLNEDCVGREDNWISFDKRLDPDNIFFELSEGAVDLFGRNARFGLAFSERLRRYYPLVLQPVRDSADQVLVSATGKIDFDTANASFRVGKAQRGQGKNIESNFVQLNTKRCVLEGDGIFDLGLDWGLSPDIFKWKAAGTFRHLILPDSTYLDMVLLLNFYFDKNAAEMIADSIRIANLPVVNTSEGLFPIFLRKVLGAERSAVLITQLSLYGQMDKVPKEIEHMLLFSDLRMKWNPGVRSFISQGPIGVGYIAGKAVNKYVGGYIQLEKGRSGDAVHIYLELSRKQWYFFSYRYGIMQVISSDNEFNMYLEELSPGKRMLNPESDTEYYEYVISTRRKQIEFVRKMEKLRRR